nr:fibroblast growth factor [Samia ricini nucleopolyhedrovirus]
MHRFVLAALAAASLCQLNAAKDELEHITGTGRLVQLFINHRYLAVRPNGIVEGTSDALSADTVLQRVRGNTRGHILLRNAVTCMHVCLDRCGTMYASATVSSDCFLNEMFTETNHNVLHKVYDRKVTYVALDNVGRARRVQISKRRSLRNMSKYTFIMRKPLNYTVITQCPKHKKVVRHRHCRLL